MDNCKFFHLIGTKNGRHYGYTFCYKVGVGTVSYSVARCSYREGNFVKSRGRAIAHGRMAMGSNNEKFVQSFEKPEFGKALKSMIEHYIQFEHDKNFRRLLSKWLVS